MYLNLPNLKDTFLNIITELIAVSCHLSKVNETAYFNSCADEFFFFDYVEVGLAPQCPASN